MGRRPSGDILTPEREIGPAYAIGIFTPEQGMSINPYRHVTAIAADFVRRGGRIVRERATAIALDGDRVCAVRGEHGDYACEHAAICAGAWSTQLLAALGYALPLAN